MKDLAANVALETGRMVVDATGLTGYYEISLSWTRDQDNLAPTDSSQERVGQTSLSIYAALEQQLGLKLEPRREPVDVLVVDHVERPSLN